MAGIKCLMTAVYRFIARFMIVSILIKNGLDIVLINRDSPTTIVRRTHLLITGIQQYIYIDQDLILRFVMLHQKDISFGYGALIVALSVLVALNIRFFVKPLVALILASIMFFYVDIHPQSTQLISDKNFGNV